MLRNIPSIYKKPSWVKIVGVLLSTASLITGLLLVTTSAWFITATAFAGLGIISLQTYNLFLPSAIIRLLAIGRPLARYQERFFTHKATLKTLSLTRVWLFRKIAKVKKENLLLFRTSALAHELVADVDALNGFYLGVVVPWFSALFAFFIFGAFLLITLPPLAWLLLISFLVSGLFVPYMVYKSAKSMAETAMRLQGQVYNDLSVLLRGVTDLRIYGQILNQKKLITKASDLEQNIRRESKTKLAFFTMVQQITLQGAFILAIYIIIHNSMRLSGPTIVLTILGFATLFDTLLPLTAQAHEFAGTDSAGSRIKKWEQAREEPLKEGLSIGQGACSVSICDLSCFYGDRKLFKNLSFTFLKNSITVITGSNGAGKTTLLDILAGLKTPNKGIALYESVPMAKIASQTLLTNIGYMEQQAVLFNISVYDNIAMAKEGATFAEINQAAIMAGLHSRISSDPDFLTSNAGESGKNLSGGEAKMISLARIILKDAPILLLDEPTEGLDTEAEIRLINLLVSWKKNKTIVMVTHKKAFIAIADSELNLG